MTIRYWLGKAFWLIVVIVAFVFLCGIFPGLQTFFSQAGSLISSALINLLQAFTNWTSGLL